MKNQISITSQISKYFEIFLKSKYLSKQLKTNQTKSRRNNQNEEFEILPTTYIKAIFKT